MSLILYPTNRETRYVTEVSSGYQPVYYPSSHKLDKVLKGKIIINQTDKVLTDAQIETLSLGLNFIFSVKNKQERKQLERDLEVWERKINTAIYFSEKRKFHHTGSGWLTKETTSTWTPPPQSWEYDNEIQNLRTQILQPNNKETMETPKSILMAVKELRGMTDIHILPADKGRNTTLWKTDEYDREALRQLEDKTTYLELPEEEYTKQLLDLGSRCDDIADSLLRNDHITKRERDAMVNAIPKGSHIYFLPKPHKGLNKTTQTFYGRPVVATHSAKIHLLDKYITALTAKLLERIPGSLRDTGDLLNRLPKTVKGEHTKLATADVIGLYPNIPWIEGIRAAVELYETNLEWLNSYAMMNGLKPPPNASTFREILELILKNSYISFKNRRFFKQIQGTAMGMCISVYFANAYMYMITKTVIHHPPKGITTFLRYIDDIFVIIETNEADPIENLFRMISNNNIKYTIEKPATTQPFLDLLVEIDTDSKTIETETYWKETASGSFLHPRSNHPKHTIKSIPRSQFLRISRNASTLERYWNGASRLKTELRRLTYPMQWVSEAMMIAAKEHGKVNRRDFSKSIKLITTHNEAATLMIDKKKMNEFSEALAKHYKDSPITELLGSSQKVTRVGTHLGTSFTKQIKNPQRE